MKIALVTEDGVSISKHFGRSRYYMVVKVEDHEIKEKKLLVKEGCNHSENHSERHEEEDHGIDQDSKHQCLVNPISDCEAVICGGMGLGAYQSLMVQGINVLITKIELIEDAIRAYIEGNIDNHLELLH